MPYIRIMLLTIVFALSLSACRVRLIDVALDTEPTQETTTTEPEPLKPEPPPPTLPEQEPETETETTPNEIVEEVYAPTIEPMAYDPIETPTEEEPGGYTAGYYTAPILIEELPYTPQVTIETPTNAPGETTLDDDGDGTLGLIIDRYTGILNSGLGSLFECQRLYVYFEQLAAFHTVNRLSPEHMLIIESGGYNVASRRGNDALIVYADWVQRRNPAVIIKSVSSDILGQNVTSTSRAEATRQEILTRPGLEGVNAVLHRRVLLISEELLLSEEGRLIAKLHIAHAMYPTLFSDVDMSGLYRQVAATGGADYTSGIFTF